MAILQAIDGLRRAIEEHAQRSIAAQVLIEQRLTSLESRIADFLPHPLSAVNTLASSISDTAGAHSSIFSATSATTAVPTTLELARLPLAALDAQLKAAKLVPLPLKGILDEAMQSLLLSDPLASPGSVRSAFLDELRKRGFTDEQLSLIKDRCGSNVASHFRLAVRGACTRRIRLAASRQYSLPNAPKDPTPDQRASHEFSVAAKVLELMDMDGRDMPPYRHNANTSWPTSTYTSCLERALVANDLGPPTIVTARFLAFFELTVRCWFLCGVPSLGSSLGRIGDQKRAFSRIIISKPPACPLAACRPNQTAAQPCIADHYLRRDRAR